MTDLVRSHARVEAAPAPLRRRIMEQVEDRRRGLFRMGLGAGLNRHRQLYAWLAVLMGVGVIGILLSTRGRENQVQQLAEALIEDHARSQPSALEIASSDRSAVQEWFRGRVDFAVRLPSRVDAILAGARLCHLRGRRAALIYYRKTESIISLFVLDSSDIPLTQERLITIEGKSCLVDSRKGYDLVLWQERGLLYGLVGDMGSAGLLQLASQF